MIVPEAGRGLLRAARTMRLAAGPWPLRLMGALAGAVGLAACTPMVGPGPFGEPMSGNAYVVRHMEKAGGDDPSLTPAGHADAVRLADRMVADPPIAIYATDTRRARQTAGPTAAWNDLPVRQYDGADPRPLAAALAVRPGTVLIVGHSDTVPDLVARLGGTRPPPISDTTYGVVYRIERATGRTTTYSLR